MMPSYQFLSLKKKNLNMSGIIVLDHAQIQ